MTQPSAELPKPIQTAQTEHPGTESVHVCEVGNEHLGVNA